MTDSEIADLTTHAQGLGMDAQGVEILCRFIEEDSGGQFIMMNLLDVADNGDAGEARAAMNEYTAYMFPQLLSRAGRVDVVFRRCPPSLFSSFTCSHRLRRCADFQAASPHIESLGISAA